MKTIDPAQNPKVEHHVREFLKALNSGGVKPIEALTPAEARKVLVDAQASVPLNLPLAIPAGILAVVSVSPSNPFKLLNEKYAKQFFRSSSLDV